MLNANGPCLFCFISTIKFSCINILLLLCLPPVFAFVDIISVWLEVVNSCEGQFFVGVVGRFFMYVYACIIIVISTIK